MRLEIINPSSNRISCQEWNSSKRLVNLFSHAIWKVIYRIRAQKLLKKLKSSLNTKDITNITENAENMQLNLNDNFANRKIISQHNPNPKLKTPEIYIKSFNSVKELQLLSTNVLETQTALSTDASVNLEWNFSQKRVNTPSLLQSQGLNRFIQTL